MKRWKETKSKTEILVETKTKTFVSLVATSYEPTSR